jgi:acyl-coenzyme A synthetase/AMP-(fatty) acid ligase
MIVSPVPIDRLDQDPSRIAIHSEHEGISKTFAELDQDVKRLSTALHSNLTLKRGDVIALWSANCYNWLVCQYAAARNGLILCTLNPMYQKTELEYALNKSGAKVLIMPGEQSNQSTINSFPQILADLSVENVPELSHVLLLDDSSINKCSAKLNVQSIDSLIKSSQSELYQPMGKETPDSDDPAIIMFTSVSEPSS